MNTPQRFDWPKLTAEQFNNCKTEPVMLFEAPGKDRFISILPDGSGVEIIEITPHGTNTPPTKLA